MTHEQAKEFTESVTWTFAKTMPNNPHEYIVKGEVDPEKYEDFYRYIYSNYVIVWFWRKPYKAVYIGDYMYWIMTDNIAESRIINRKYVNKNGRKERQ